MVDFAAIGVQCMAGLCYSSGTWFQFLALQFKAWVVIVILSETWFILWLPLVFKAWVDAVIFSETWSNLLTLVFNACLRH